MNTVQEAFRAFVTVITAVAAAICCGFIVKHVALAFDTTMLPTFFITAAIILGGMLLYFAVPWGTLFTKKRKSWSIPVSQRGTNHGWVSMPGQQGVYPTLAAQAAPAGTQTVKQPNLSVRLGEWINQHQKGTVMVFASLVGFAFLAASVILSVKAVNADQMSGYVMGAFFSLVIGTGILLAVFGKLGAVGTWAGKNLGFVWLTISTLLAIYFGLSAYESAYIWHWNSWEWVHVAFVSALISAFITGAYLAGYLPAIGTFFLHLHNGHWHIVLSLIVICFEVVLTAFTYWGITGSPVFDQFENGLASGDLTMLSAVVIVGLVGFGIIFGTVYAVVMSWRRKHSW